MFNLDIHLLHSIDKGKIKYKMIRSLSKIKFTKTMNIDTLCREYKYIHENCLFMTDTLKTLSLCDLTQKKDLYELIYYFKINQSLKIKHLQKNRNHQYPLFMQKQVISQNSRLVIIGDIHCDLKSLITILDTLKDKRWINNDFRLKSNINIIFLGDMVDYGYLGIEILFIILLLYYHNPKQVFIINGNHDDVTYHKHHQFGKEKRQKLMSKEHKHIVHVLDEILNMIPCVLFLRFKNTKKYFQFCHGGVDQHCMDLSYFLNSRINIIPVTYKMNEHLFIYPCHSHYNTTGFKWTDFNQKTECINQNTSRSRGKKSTLIKIGPRCLETYLQNNNIYSIISGHQDRNVFQMILNDKQKKNKKLMYNIRHQLYRFKSVTCNSTFQLDPTKDFLACVTSTALNKGVKCTTFISLQSKQ